MRGRGRDDDRRYSPNEVRFLVEGSNQFILVMRMITIKKKVLRVLFYALVVLWFAFIAMHLFVLICGLLTGHVVNILNGAYGLVLCAVAIMYLLRER